MRRRNASARTWGRRRSTARAVWDAAGARVLKLPKASHRYRTIDDVPIPMRDGIELLADVLVPLGESKGTVLFRSPYGWPPLIAGFTASMYARHGYTVVLARCRGTFGSGGRLEPLVNEAADGADTVVWLRRQPWFTGTFATAGGSYVGCTQFAILMDPPPELVTSVIQCAPFDLGRHIYRDGAFALDAWFGWTLAVLRQESGFVRSSLEAWRARKNDARLERVLPLARGASEAFGARAPWYRAWISHRDADDSFWADYDLSASLDRIQVPILFQVGWQDAFLDQGVEAVQQLQKRGADVAMTAGPWTHKSAPLEGGFTVKETLQWLDQHFERSSERRSSPVRVFVGGAEEWIALPSWPPPAEESVLYPHPEGVLLPIAAAEGSRGELTYRPEDPTPSLGGPLIAPNAGRVDDSALGTRDDVLAFTGAPLDAPMRIVGAPRVELTQELSNPHADVFARLSVIDGAGRSRNLTEGFVRLDPDSASGDLVLTLDPTAYEFRKGERIRLVLAGGSFPRWERNLGTGQDPATSSDLVPSSRIVDLRRSRLILPVASGN